MKIILTILTITLFIFLTACIDDGDDTVDTVASELSGPLQMSCPLSAGCAVGGYHFGDAWTIGARCNGVYEKHTGLDLHAAARTRVNAAASGQVAAISVPHLHFAIWNGTNTTASHRGRLPPAPCGGDPAFPASFEDPARYIRVRP